MFIKLEKEQYLNVIQLFDYTGNECVFAFAVIENNIPGEIYVDNVTAPNSALICSYYGKYLIIGDETNQDFNTEVSNFLTDKSNHNTFYDLYTSSEEWIEVLSKSLSGQAVVLKFCVYYYNKSTPNTVQNIPLPSGLELKQIDDALFHKIGNEFSSSFKYHFGNVEKFCSKNFGFCITKEDELLSVVAASYNGNGYAEIDIETRADFYKKGLAFNLCKEFIGHCLKNNLTALWICDAGNKPSNQLASKLGFMKSKEVEMLWWHENPGVIAGYLNKFNY